MKLEFVTVYESDQFSQGGGKAVIARDPRAPGAEGYGRTEDEAAAMLRKVLEVRKMHTPDSYSVGGSLPKKTPHWVLTPPPAYA